MVCDSSEQFQQTTRNVGIINPDFSLVRTPQGLAVCEKTSKIGFLLQKPKHNLS